MKCYPTTNFKLDLSKLSQTLSPSLPTRLGTSETLIEQSGSNGKVEGCWKDRPLSSSAYALLKQGIRRRNLDMTYFHFRLWT